ncbi:hypothetical protein QFZ77_007404 [Paenibacillus sp. V4I3]|nr:hypothetical protein [Paenibacillus sp. V4I3]MDQ0885402.1 hypothetical protein [Paenibacillus sp. V4I9]
MIMSTFSCVMLTLEQGDSQIQIINISSKNS